MLHPVKMSSLKDKITASGELDQKISEAAGEKVKEKVVKLKNKTRNVKKI